MHARGFPIVAGGLKIFANMMSSAGRGTYFSTIFFAYTIVLEHLGIFERVYGEGVYSCISNNGWWSRIDERGTYFLIDSSISSYLPHISSHF